MKLTNTAVDNLTLGADERERFVWDDGLVGFGVRLRRGAPKGGKGRVLKRYVVQYRTADDGQRRLTLGDASVVRYVAAKAKAREVLAKVRLGEDPQAAKAAARRTVTFLVRAKEYLAENARRWRAGTQAVVRRHLLNHAAPLHAKPLERITRAEVAGLASRIAHERGQVAADRARVSLSGMFAWCIVHHALGANPCVGIPGNAGTSRDRVLNAAELAAIWNSTDDNSDFSRVVRLLMLTACRRAEIGGMRWSEVDGGMFVLPVTRSKNKRAHEVWLHSLAVSQLPPRVAGRDGVFGSTGAGFSAWSDGKRRLDDRLNGRTQNPWTLHDLRRSCATWLSENGTEPHIVEAVLGHVGAKKGVSGVYNRASYSRAKREALAKWTEHIAAIAGVNTANVTSLMQLRQQQQQQPGRPT